MPNLTPVQCIDILLQRIRKRIAMLEGMNMGGYRVAVAELQSAEKWLQGAKEYLAGK